MKTKVTFTIILLLILFIVFFILYIKYYNEIKQNNIINNNKAEVYETVCGKYEKREIKINEKILSADISDDNCKRELGLSGKKILNDGEAMLFILKIPRAFRPGFRDRIVDNDKPYI